jgi:hypothetical protein
MARGTKHGKVTPLSGEDLVAALALIEHSDSVELKLSVADSERWSAMTALDMDPLDAQMRQVYFFDTPDLTLDKHGIVARARRVQGRGDDSVIKLRPVVPGELDPKLRAAPDFVVEVDAMPGGYVCSGSYKGALDRPGVTRVAAGERPVRKLFSKQQRRFFADHAPEGLELDDLALLGPITVMKIKCRPKGLDRRLVAELWVYPDGSRILELSTRCSPAEPLSVAKEAREFLEGKGIDVGAEQHTKTRTAMAYFAGG